MNGADPNLETPNPWRDSCAVPLWLALNCGSEGDSLGTVQVLLNDLRTNPKIKRTTDGWTPLMAACFERWGGSHPEQHVEALLKRSDININELDGQMGAPALIWAAWLRKPEFVRNILPYPGIEVGIRTRDGPTVLMAAVSQRDADIIEEKWESYQELIDLLLEQKNIDINAQDEKGWTALHRAASASLDVLGEVQPR